MTEEKKHSTYECRYFYYDREGYPICGRCGLCCDPTDDEKCPNAEWKTKEDTENHD